jgi:hypothetical protein
VPYFSYLKDNTLYFFPNVIALSLKLEGNDLFGGAILEIKKNVAVKKMGSDRAKVPPLLLPDRWVLPVKNFVFLSSTKAGCLPQSDAYVSR